MGFTTEGTEGHKEDEDGERIDRLSDPKGIYAAYPEGV